VKLGILVNRRFVPGELVIVGSRFSASDNDEGAVSRSFKILLEASLFKLFFDEVNSWPTSSETLVIIPFSGRSFSRNF